MPPSSAECVGTNVRGDGYGWTLRTENQIRGPARPGLLLMLPTNTTAENYTRPNTNAAFVPPKPKLLDITSSSFADSL